jgi:hypothetical protein
MTDNTVESTVTRGRGCKMGLKREKVVALYSKLGTISKVAAKLGCSYTTIRYHLIKAEVPGVGK